MLRNLEFSYTEYAHAKLKSDRDRNFFVKYPMSTYPESEENIERLHELDREIEGIE